VTNDHTAEVFSEISRSGYYPEVVAEGLRDAIAGERVLASVLHHEPTFERDEIRRHMTVLALTPTRIVLLHTDEHAGDDLLPHPYTSTTSEAVPVGQVRSVVVTRMVSSVTNRLEEGVLTIGWGAVSRVDLEPAQCDDPACEADHGYTGNVTGDDFSLRLSATADGGAAVGRQLEFARILSGLTTNSATA
jgi:hypothetical protein